MGTDGISISNVRMAAWSKGCPDAPKAKRVVVRPSDDPDPIEELARIVGGTPVDEPPLNREGPPLSIRGRGRRRLGEAALYLAADHTRGSTGSLQSNRRLCAIEGAARRFGERDE